MIKFAPSEKWYREMASTEADVNEMSAGAFRKQLACFNCRFWEADDFCKDADLEYQYGKCDELPGDMVDIELDGGLNGAVINEITTDAEFFCASFKEKD